MGTCYERYVVLLLVKGVIFVDLIPSTCALTWQLLWRTFMLVNAKFMPHPMMFDLTNCTNRLRGKTCGQKVKTFLVAIFKI